MPSAFLLPFRPPVRSRASRLLLGAGLAGLLVGCGVNAEANDVGESPTQGQLVRTPSPLGTDLPSTDPPLVQDPPGATGAPPDGEAPTTAPEASPGEDADGGDDSPAN